MAESVAVLDCGGQFTKVIDRKVRELGVKTEIYPVNVETEKLNGVNGIIIADGPESVRNANPNMKVLDLNVPVLGICLGTSLIAEYFGGEVKPLEKKQDGTKTAKLSTDCPLFAGLKAEQQVLFVGADTVKMPKGFKACAECDGVVAGIYNEDKKIYGVRFHPEAGLTENGIKIFENFLRGICELKEQYALEDRLQMSVDMIKKKVGDKKVVSLVSGGVDSAVTTALLLRALPAENVYAVHVDHGLMRKGESDRICDNLTKLGLKNLKRVNAEEIFFNTPIKVNGEEKILSQQTDPEMKRAIIGTAFIEVTKKACDEFGLDFDNTFIAQGTLRPDLIESGNPEVSGFAKKIKTHHNDVDVVRAARERGMIVETNWDWHKDEVRKIALMLGLDEEIAYRQPFPGPGLGVRILCAEKPVEVTAEEKADLEKYIAGYKGFTAAAAPIRSVGVEGDTRSYRKTAVIAGGNYEDARKIAKELPNTVKGFSRVIYCLDCDKIPGELTITPTHICRESADLLRELDAIATKALRGKNIAQCFAVLLPVGVNGSNKHSVVLRAVVTTDFMTAAPAVIGKDVELEAVNSAVKEIRKNFGDKIDLIAFDLTGKPPATVEFE